MEKEETKPCPLCATMLPYDKWLKVVGVYEEQQKHRKQLESELNKAKEQEIKLKEEYKKFRLKEKEIRDRYALKESKINQQYKIRLEKSQEKFEKERHKILNHAKREGIRIGSEKEKEKIEKLKQKSQQEKEKIKKQLERQKEIELKQIYQKGIGTGIGKQKARTEKVSKMAEKHRKERDKAMERVKELEEMGKRGTTPQIEGFNFEQDFAQQLRQKFPKDEIKLTGHKGDIIHIVRVQDKKSGIIIYECKKTKEFENKFIEQIRRDRVRAIADYGVLVTWATKERKQNFWIEKDIIVIHPLGALDVAILLRETLIQIYALKLSKTEIETKSKAVLEFIQSEEFKIRIENSIVKSKEVYESLKKEITTHFNVWNKRKKIYESIYANTNVIQNTVRYLLLHNKIPENLPEIEQLPALPILPREEKIDVKDIPF